VVRTRVGYAGGTTENPTYYNLADHTETIQMDYDPAKITYEQLLDVFWDSHNPTSPAWSRQYMSIVFYHDEQQKKAAETSKAREAIRRGKEVSTVIVPASEFYLAEDYHQKHSLRSRSELLNEYLAIYPNGEDFVNSTAVTRANGYVGGSGTLDALEKEQDTMGLSPEARHQLWALVSTYDRSRSADRTEDAGAKEQSCSIGDGGCG
jgi:peptide-methionine (S)-S-oxide reductase